MMTSTARRMGQLKQLARAGVWIASGSVWALVYVSPGWTWIAIASLVALGALSVFAAVAEAKADGTWGGVWPKGGIRPKGGALTGRGHDDDDGPPAPPVPGWRALAVVSRLMPRPAGRRWRSEAESLLAELPPARRRAALRSYLLSAPRLALIMWARQALRRTRPGPRRPG